MTLTKADIVESIIAQIGIPRPDARQMVDDLFEEVRACLATGEAVKLSGFGNFVCLFVVLAYGLSFIVSSDVFDAHFDLH